MEQTLTGKMKVQLHAFCISLLVYRKTGVHMMTVTVFILDKRTRHEELIRRGRAYRCSGSASDWTYPVLTSTETLINLI
jgi:hypothetical protein